MAIFKTRIKDNGNGDLQIHWGLKEAAIIIGIIIGIIAAPTIAVIRTVLKAEVNEVNILKMETVITGLASEVNDNSKEIAINSTEIDNIITAIDKIDTKIDKLIMIESGDQ